MRSLPLPEELVAAYWRKLTRSIENSGARPRFKIRGLNGHLQSRVGIRRGSEDVRNGKRLRSIHSMVRES